MWSLYFEIPEISFQPWTFVLEKLKNNWEIRKSEVIIFPHAPHPFHVQISDLHLLYLTHDLTSLYLNNKNSIDSKNNIVYFTVYMSKRNSLYKSAST